MIQQRQIIDEDLHACTPFVLDAVVNAVAARETTVGRCILDWWRKTGTGDTGRQALLAGALVHTLEMDDLHKKSVTHPGCVVVPAALAMAAREGRSGRDLLIAVLRGYEAMCRVGNAVGRSHYKVWHSTATCGPFGSAMAAANLLGLSADQMVWSLGNAGTQSAGLWEFMNSGGMSKHLHAGRAAEAGVLAADLARSGFTGPERILEGDQGIFVATCPDATPGEILASRHDDWQLTRTSIKPWPCCRHTHPVIDAALELSPGLDSPVKTVSVRIYQAALDVCDRPDPGNEYEAKFSLQHCVAVALDRGVVDFSSFSEEARVNTATTRSTVRVELSTQIDSAYPDDWGCELEIITRDGQTLSTARAHCKGDPELPLSADGMVQKAHTLLDYAGMPQDRQQQLIEYILDLENQPQVLGIIDLLNIDS